MRYLSRGVPVWLYICNQARFYKCSSLIHIGIAFLCLQVNLVESLYLSTSIMGRTRYTNPWVPEVHTHVTTKTQKHHYRIIFILLHCYLHYCIAYHILFYLHSHLMIDNHSVELGTQDKEVVLQVS
jgi:hypothetical protein